MPAYNQPPLGDYVAILPEGTRPWAAPADLPPPMFTPSPPMSPPPPTSPPPSPILDLIFGVDNIVSDSNLANSAILSCVVGGIFLLLFMLLNQTSVLYRFRLVSPSVSCKPPLLPVGVNSLWAWLWAIFAVNDYELLATSGLDALMMVKIQTLGIQLFLPMAFFGGVVLIPINFSGNFVTESAVDQNHTGSVNPSQFMKLTVTNISNSDWLWVHFVAVLVYVYYACFLLKWHYHQYVIVRQQYLAKGDDVNVWRDLQHSMEEEEVDESTPLFDPLARQKGFFGNMMNKFKIGRSGSSKSERLGAEAGPQIPEEAIEETLRSDEDAALIPKNLFGDSSRILDTRFKFNPISVVQDHPSTPTFRSSPDQKLGRAHSGDGGSKSVVDPQPSSLPPSNHVKDQVNDPFLRHKEALRLQELLEKEIEGFDGSKENDTRSRKSMERDRNGGEGGVGESRPPRKEQSLLDLMPSFGKVDRQLHQLLPTQSTLVESEREKGKGKEGKGPGGAGEEEVPQNPSVPSAPLVGPSSSLLSDSASNGGPHPPSSSHTIEMSASAVPPAPAPALTFTPPKLSNEIVPLDIEAGSVETPRRSTSKRREKRKTSFNICSSPGPDGYDSEDSEDWDSDVIEELPKWWLIPEFKHPSANDDIETQRLLPSSLSTRSAPLTTRNHRRNISWMSGLTTSWAPHPPAVQHPGGASAMTTIESGELSSDPSALFSPTIPVKGSKTQSQPAMRLSRTLDPSTPPLSPSELSSPTHPSSSYDPRLGPFSDPSAAPPKLSSRPRALLPQASLVRKLLEQGLLSQPSVRFRKTINVFDSSSQERVAVNAQQYCVLVTDVNQDPLNPGRRLWRKTRVKDGPGIFGAIMGHLRRRFSLNFASPWTESEIDQDEGAVVAACCLPRSDERRRREDTMAGDRSDPADAATRTVSSPLSSPFSRPQSSMQDSQLLTYSLKKRGGGRKGSKWGIIREAVFDGRIRLLPSAKEYSIVSSTFLKLFPDSFDRAVPVIRHKEVDELLTQLDLCMWDFQRADTYRRKTGKRPEGRICLWGLWGPKVDLIRHHRSRLIELQHKVREARRDAQLRGGGTPSWFVFFKTQHAAAVASQVLIHGEDNREFNVSPAPGPEEVNWSALWLSYKDRQLRGWICKPILTFLILIPIGMFSASLLQLELLLCPTHTCMDNLPLNGSATHFMTQTCPNGTHIVDGTPPIWPYYCDGSGGFLANTVGKLITGWTPALLITLWQGMFLTRMTYIFVQATGQCLSLSEVDRQIADWFWFFSAFNSFVGGIVGSTLASQFLNIINEGPGEVISIIGNFVPSSSSFFLNYVMFRTLVSTPMRLLIPHPQLRFYILRRWIFRSSSIPLTPRDKAFLYAPTSPRYGFEIGLQCGIFLIALAFSVISPIITVACCVYFAATWVFWRYSVLYVYVRKYESGGLMWPFIFNRILVMLVVMAVFTSCVFIVKGAFVQATLLLILVPTWVGRFSHYSWHRFQKGIEAIPLESAQKQVPARVDPRVYIPPPLISKATGWYPEWTKVWAGWGLP